MKKLTGRTLLRGIALVLAVLMLTACGANSASSGSDGDSAAAEGIGFPTKETITLVVPGKAGGGGDLAIRYYSEGLNRIYGLKTTVTNYDSNTVGHQTVANAKPDGTTLTIATSALNIQYITGNAEVNPMTDFTLIGCVQDNGFSTLAVPADAPYDDFAGFVEYALAHPGELNAGMPAAGANTFLFGKLTKATGIELNKVECASESDRLTNLAGGFIDIGVVNIGNALQYEQAGKLKVIATVASDGVTIADYPEELPDNYKTLQEQGFQDCYNMVYHYLLGPAGMDETMVKEMNAAMEAIINDPTVSAGVAGVGYIPGWHNLEDSRAIWEKEYDETVAIAKDLGMYVQG
ncbi:MAG: Bug family tripartite tricarboxylate transporter substrate binding protein [Faecousia sp.]